MKKRILLFTIFLISLSSASFSAGTFETFSYLCKDSVSRPYIVYKPEKINQHALLVFLHGSISNPNLKENPLEYMQTSKMVDIADEAGCYLLFPYGQAGATWFDAVGTDMILGEIKAAKKEYKISSSRVFLGGFSDGASGAMYQATLNPDHFAGFIALNGSIKVAAKLAEQHLFLENAKGKPMLIINTNDDMLYPIDQIESSIEYFKKYNPSIEFIKAKGNHEMTYLADEKEHLIKFIQTQQKKWQANTSMEVIKAPSAAINGVRIVSIKTTVEPATWHKNYQLTLVDNRANLGTKYDYTFKGPGLKVDGFTSDTASAIRMGMRVGDVILMMEKDSMLNSYSPFIYLANKQALDKTIIEVKRGRKKLKLKGNFNAGYQYEVFPEAPNSAKLILYIEGNSMYIKTSRVASFSIDFSEYEHLNLNNLYINENEFETELKGKQFFTLI